MPLTDQTAPAGSEVLRLQQVDKTFNAGTPLVSQVLHDINLRLCRGELAALIGPSGSGKSTLLNLIGLLDTPSSGELYLLGGHISALPEASTHIRPDPTRTRKLLLKAEEIERLIGKVEQRGFTLVPLDLHFTRGRIKCEIALAKGKAQHDKRDATKDREWLREKQRVISDFNKRS